MTRQEWEQIAKERGAEIVDHRGVSFAYIPRPWPNDQNLGGVTYIGSYSDDESYDGQKGGQFYR